MWAVEYSHDWEATNYIARHFNLKVSLVVYKDTAHISYRKLVMREIISNYRPLSIKDAIFQGKLLARTERLLSNKIRIISVHVASDNLATEDKSALVALVAANMLS